MTESDPLICLTLLFVFDAAFELGGLVARGPHPAVVFAGLGGERAALAPHAVALQRIEGFGFLVVVDVEVHRRARLPQAAALLALPPALAFPLPLAAPEPRAP